MNSSDFCLPDLGAVGVDKSLPFLCRSLEAPASKLAVAICGVRLICFSVSQRSLSLLHDVKCVLFVCLFLVVLDRRVILFPVTPF